MRRLGNGIKGLLSLAFIVTFITGVPAALYAFAGKPWPSTLPTGDQISRFLSGSAVTDSFIVKTIAVIAWLAWMQLVFCIVVEIVAWARGRAAGHVPFSGPMQPFAHKLVATAALIFTVGVPMAGNAMPALATTNLSAPMTEMSYQAADTSSMLRTAPTMMSTSSNDALTQSVGQVKTVSTAKATKTYTVVKRDTLWDIADSHLGDGMRWKEIFELNKGMPQSDGKALTDPQMIRTGWVLAMPADAYGLQEVEVAVEAQVAETRTPAIEKAVATPAPETKVFGATVEHDAPAAPMTGIRPGAESTTPTTAPSITAMPASNAIQSTAPSMSSEATNNPFGAKVETAIAEVGKATVSNADFRATHEGAAPDVSIPPHEVDLDNLLPPDPTPAPAASTPTPPPQHENEFDTPAIDDSNGPVFAAPDVSIPGNEVDMDSLIPPDRAPESPVYTSIPAAPMSNLTPQTTVHDDVEINDVKINDAVTIEKVSTNVGPEIVRVSADLGDVGPQATMPESAMESFDVQAGYKVDTPEYNVAEVAAQRDLTKSASTPEIKGAALEVSEVAFAKAAGIPMSPSSSANSPTAVYDGGTGAQFPAKAAGSEEGTSIYDADVVLPAGIVGSFLLATGAYGVIRRRRAAQARKRFAGNIVPVPDPSTALAETALRMASNPRGAAWMASALRALSGELVVRPGSSAPVPKAVQLTDKGLEVLLSTGGNVDAPFPWRVASGGWAWTLAADTPLDDINRAAAGAHPMMNSLVTLGRSETGSVLVDLEAFGTTCVTGDEAQSAGFVHSAVFELATSPLTDQVDILLVGMDLPGLSTLPNVAVVANFEQAEAALVEHARGVIDALRAARLPNTFSARTGRSGNDPLSPIVIVAPAESLSPAVAERLLKMVGDGGRGTAALIVGRLAGVAWNIHVNNDFAEIPQLGLKVRAQHLQPNDVNDIGELLLQSNDADVENPQSLLAGVPENKVVSVLPESAPLRAGESFTSRDPRSSFVDPPFDVEVNLLGSVEVLRGRAPLDRRQAELIAFLALYPGGVTDEQIKTALWPERLPALSTFNNLVSTTRTRLGGAPGSSDLYLPLAYDGRYLVSKLVITDLARFRARVAYARHVSGDDQYATLRDAIRLVRGQPFSGVSRGYEWVSIRGLLVTIESEVVDACHLLAQLCIDRGDNVAAQEAINAGLLVSPANELLIRDRMLAYDREGNPMGVENTMRDLYNAIEVDGPISTDDVHPETYALYERLTRRRKTASA